MAESVESHSREGRPAWLAWLNLPELSGIDDLDAAGTTLLHARIIRRKPLLRRFYEDCYARFRSALGPSLGGLRIVEVGSGAGFIKEIIPEAMTTDIEPLPHVDRQMSALQMPFTDASVDAFFMIDVFHHVPDASAFLSEMNRCLRPNGMIYMVEPASTPLSRWIYARFHHEPFEPAAGWSFVSRGRLSSANGALPWIVFCRDRDRFLAEFPALTIRQLRPFGPLLYLLSGGLTLRQLWPPWGLGIILAAEWALSPLNPLLGMFMTIQLEKDG